MGIFSRIIDIAKANLHSDAPSIPVIEFDEHDDWEREFLDKSRLPQLDPQLKEALAVLQINYTHWYSLNSQDKNTAVHNSYRSLAKLYHSDKGGDNEKFLAVGEAYQLIKRHLDNEFQKT